LKKITKNQDQERSMRISRGYNHLVISVVLLD